MIYKNTQKAILVLADRDSVQPFGITRDISDEEAIKDRGIKGFIDKGVLIPFDGKVAAPAPRRDARQAQWQTDLSSGRPVKTTTNTGRVVEYVVADLEGCDGVTEDPESVTSVSGNKSIDSIEPGVDASKYRNASEAFDAILDKESGEDAEFDDESSLSENEPERNAIIDVDDEIAKDAAQVLVKNGKGGSSLMDVRTVVQETINKSMSDVAKATLVDVDDGEQANRSVTPEVVDFLSKPFMSKKWAIAKSTDTALLTEVARVTGSENIKTLATQRLTELGKK